MKSQREKGMIPNEQIKRFKKVGFVLAIVLFMGCFPKQAQSASSKQSAKDTHTAGQDMAWWREARFGLFIHWGPVSIKGTEIGWSRGREIPVEVYDSLYKEFNPTRFNAAEWVSIAKAAGAKYIVITSKHHDGFCIFDSKYTDYDITTTPFKRDVIKELSQTCQAHGIKLCFYHSIIDWHHPDYLPRGAGDKRTVEDAVFDRYVTYMKNQLRELLTNYGPIGILWFDGEWDPTWTHEQGLSLYQYIKELQPNIIINNRVDKGREGMDGTNKGAEYTGDYDTPEQKIGKFNTDRPWETCMTICQQWAWKPNDNMKSFAQCIQTLVRTAGGDGNLLFNVGPMPDGRIEPRQVERLKEMGDWLKKYGETIYDTRGGPFFPDKWGCSTYRGDKVYVHVMQWSGAELLLPALEQRIGSARALTGGNVTFRQEKEAIHVWLPEANRDAVDSIIELQLAGPVKGMAKSKRAPTAFDRGDYGKWISKDATYEASSIEPQWSSNEKKLLSGEEYEGGYCFHTKEEANPSIVIALGRTAVVKGIEIVNRQDMHQNRARTLTVWVSKDKQEWRQVWKAEKTQDVWEVPVTEFVAGIQQAGVAARYIKIGLQEKNYLHLYSVKVYGDAE